MPKVFFFLLFQLFNVRINRVQCSKYDFRYCFLISIAMLFVMRSVLYWLHATLAEWILYHISFVHLPFVILPSISLNSLTSYNNWWAKKPNYLDWRLENCCIRFRSLEKASGRGQDTVMSYSIRNIYIKVLA